MSAAARPRQAGDSHPHRGGRASRLVVTAPDAFATTGAEEIARAIRDVSARPGSSGFSLALSGGSTPRPVHECLALEPGLPWQSAEIFFVDERAVPPDDPRSNYLLARQTLLDHVSVRGESVHRMEAEAPDPDAAAERYAALLPERLDVVVLGMGADGHTASLFPHATALNEEVRRTLAVEAPAGVEPSRRLTLTPPVVRAARRVIVLVAGASKAEATRRALAPAGTPADCPARIAHPAVWVLDSGGGRARGPCAVDGTLTVMVLAGDIGGTHARLALVDSSGPRRKLVERRTYVSRESASLEAVVADFLERTRAAPDAGCIGVACPIVGGVCEMSNLTWKIDVEVFGDRVGLPGLRFINDFDAVGWAIGELDGDEDLVTLREGDPKEHGPVALIGAGTGLGSGFMTWDSGRYRVHSSEGGHVDFAPRNPIEVELYTHLAARFPRVSYERVVSGPGLVNVYRFIVETGRAPESPEVREAIDHEDGDPSRVISANALAGDDPACMRTLDLFCSIFGAQAGNLALTVKATGGVYVAGGIAPAILDKLRDGTFERAFLDKGRVAEVVEAAPLRVIVRRDVGLLGAAVAAEVLIGER